MIEAWIVDRSMSHSPFVMLKPSVGYRHGHPSTADTVPRVALS